MQTIPSLWKGLLMFWMTAEALREGKWEEERKANHCVQNGISIAFSSHYSSNYSPPLDFLPGYFSWLFLHQNGAINWQVKLDRIKEHVKEVKSVISSELDVITVEIERLLDQSAVKGFQWLYVNSYWVIKVNGFIHQLTKWQRNDNDWNSGVNPSEHFNLCFLTCFFALCLVWCYCHYIKVDVFCRYHYSANVL